MTFFAQHLKVVCLTEHPINIFVPAPEASVNVYNRLNVVYLYVCCFEEPSAAVALVMEDKLTRCLVKLLPYTGFLQGFPFRGPFS